MRWDDYKLLTTEQKKEYNFRFKNMPVTPNIHQLWTLLLFFSMALTNAIFVTYLIFTDKSGNLSTLQQYTEMFLNRIYSLLILIAPITIGYVIIDLGGIFYYNYAYKKWKKKNNIKIKWWKIG
jgi:hypothetical protein